MLPKALWMKEWKHAAIMSFAVLILFVIRFPIQAALRIDMWEQMNKNYPQWTENAYFEINYLFSAEFLGFSAVLLIILLAGFLVGLEKGSRRHDFSMALPYSKTQMFLTKYTFGALVILLSYVPMFWLTYFVIYQSKFSFLLDHLELFQTFFSPLLGYLVIYSLAMVMGAISGDMRSQISLSIIFLVLPQGFLFLLAALFETHGLSATALVSNEFIFEDLFWFSYLNTMSDSNLWVPFIATVIFFYLGLTAYKYAQSEYAGEFLMIGSLRPIFAIGIPLCATLFGGLLIGGIVAYDSPQTLKIVVYWLGALVTLFFAWKITKRLLRF
ncbi:hypothetical protein ACLIA0_06015 [Bacillaceae bacterium W0354]